MFACSALMVLTHCSLLVCLRLVWPGAVRAPRGDSRQAHTENAGGAGGETSSSSHGYHHSYRNHRKRFRQEGESQRTSRRGPGLQQPCRNPQYRAPEHPGQSYAHHYTYALPHTYTHPQSPPALYCSCLCRTGTDVNAFQQPQSEELSIG